MCFTLLCLGMLKSASNDYLDNKGIKCTPYDNWEIINSDGYDCINDGDIVKVRKKENASMTFNDGYLFKLNNVKPKHLRYFSLALNRFSFMVETGDAEAFDVRLGKIDETGDHIGKGDILFFRAGFYNYTRINRDQMAYRHNINMWYRVSI